MSFELDIGLKIQLKYYTIDNGDHYGHSVSLDHECNKCAFSY